jgi:hypothetical protein
MGEAVDLALKYLFTQSRLNEEHITQYLANNIPVIPIGVKKAHVLIE